MILILQKFLKKLSRNLGFLLYPAQAFIGIFSLVDWKEPQYNDYL